MNDDRNSPKPLPDDFGMTIQNFRLPGQNQSSNQGGEADLPTTNLRQTPAPKPNYPQQNQAAPPAAPDDFGMTVPNMRVPPKPQPPAGSPHDLNMPTADLRGSLPQQPAQPDFGATFNNFQAPKNNQSEPDYGATMSYIPVAPTAPNPREQTRDTNAFVAPTTVPQTQPAPDQKRKSGVPLWAWLVSGGLAFVALLAVGGLLAAYFIWWQNSGFTLVVKGAPAGSTIFIDDTRRGVTSADGSTKILGIKADEKRQIKVTREGYTDFNDTILGENGATKEIVAQMRPTNVVKPQPETPKLCAEDPRVCAAENAALDALDRLKVPFTVDELVAALNLQIINFDSNSADVPPARKRFLERAAEKFKLLTGDPGVEIGGHTDNVGNAAANLSLSQDRAKAVRGLLVNFGVNPKVLTPKGFGSGKPKTGNDTDEGKFQNRRIEYTVVSR